MPRKYKHNLNSKFYRKYDPKDIADAVAAVANKTLSLRKAEEKFKINYSVINRHLKNKGSIKSQGGQTALNANEEAYIVDRLKTCADWGYPFDSFTLRMLVKDYLNASGKIVKKFKNNTPGRDFAYSFLKRHKAQISERLCQNIKRNRAAVSRETITKYFESLETELKDVPAQNIVNYDETNLRDDPGRKKVIVRRGCKYPERIMNSSKTSTSLMFSAAGDGTILPVYVVYKAANIYNSWTEGGPKQTRYNRTKSGWFDIVCFEDWVKTVAINYFKNLSGKKFLIGDNLSSHISLDVINLCLEHDIHFIFLPANSTHLTQPLDVAFFGPLKVYWRQILEKWKLGGGRSMSSVPKDKFPRLLKKLMKRIVTNGPKNVKSGFVKCGIIPLNKDKVLDMLPAETSDNNSEALKSEASRERELIDNTFIDLLKSMRYEDSAKAVKPKRKSKISVAPGKSVAAEDFSDYESTDDEEIIREHANENIETVSSSDDDSDMAVEEVSDKEVALYPLPVRQQELNSGDWLVVSFYSNSDNKGNKTARSTSLIGKLISISSSDTFEGVFLKPSKTKEFLGFIYRYPVNEEVVKFTFNEIVGKIRPPEKYKKGLLKFDFQC